MTQAAMIIHTRTRSCDFPSMLAVCPSVLSSSEIEQVRRQILAATRSIDSMRQDEVRYMVYSCGSYIVSGMVSFLKNLADHPDDDEKFFADEKGRSIYAFAGFVFRKGSPRTPRIDKKVLWDNFKLYMEPVWERTVLETQTSNFVEMDFPEADVRESAGAESVADQTLYIVGVDDAAIASYWLGQALQGKAVSFCSNVTDVRVVKEKTFHVLTTTANIIERMKREAIVAPPPPQPRVASLDAATRSSTDSYAKKNSVRNETSVHGRKFGKKFPSVCMVLLGVIFVLIALFLLLR